VRVFTSDSRQLLMSFDPDRKQSQSVRHDASITLSISTQ
jgi:hypothetical protein